MSPRQAAKAVVLDYFARLDSAHAEHVNGLLSAVTAADYRFRGVHPFDELTGADAVASQVWVPLFGAFTGLQRRQDIFFAGPNLIDGSLWVTSMGRFMGLFDAPWLGIRPTGKLALIPYCEFHRVENSRIVESALWLDIISLMRQTGYDPLGEQTGADIINPGPSTADGVLLGVSDEAESQKTLDLIMRMCNDLTGDGMHSDKQALSSTWHENMTWFGPAGIGATYTLARYEAQHQGPFNSGLRDIVFNGHVLEHAEGNYGAWFGWPNLRMRQGDGFLGMPASERQTEMRVVDVYRRNGNKLAENWIFIDFLHYLKILGVDVLGRYQQIRGVA